MSDYLLSLLNRSYAGGRGYESKVSANHEIITTEYLPVCELGYPPRPGLSIS
jgi:hypothetical protein